MNDFETALRFVHDSLVEMRAQGNTSLRASSDALTRLMEIKTVVPHPASDSKRQPIESKIQMPTARNERSAAGPSDSTISKSARMDALRARALVCVKCPHLARTRTQVVFG